MKSVALFFALLVVSMALSVCLGARNFSPAEVFDVLLGRSDLPAPHQTILMEIRLPRTLLAVMAGGALAVAGVVMQGLFRNPLAEPAIVGVSAGGAFGAVLALAMGWATTLLTLPLAAMAGSVLCTLMAFAVSVRGGRASIVALLLGGMAVNSLAGAATSMVMMSSSHFLLRDMLGWLMGTLDARTWAHVKVSAPFILGGFAGALLLARRLDLLAQGEEVAASLGVDLGRLRVWAIAVACALAGSAVAVCGIIGFVGLVVPHILRGIVGPSHGRLAAASFAGGALLLLLADLGTRVLPVASNLRLGILTAFLGVPFFLYLLRRSAGKENYA
jgi:iron complex transport system permease protein